MSWLTKVSTIAYKAEDLLNRLDQNTADVLGKQPRSATPTATTAYSVQLNRNESVSSLGAGNGGTVSEPGHETPYKLSQRSNPHTLSLNRFHQNHQNRKDGNDMELISFLNNDERNPEALAAGMAPNSRPSSSSNASHVSSIPMPMPMPIPYQAQSQAMPGSSSLASASASAGPAPSVSASASVSQSATPNMAAFGGVSRSRDETDELLRAQHSDTLRCLHLKENQMAVMSVKLQETEDLLALKDAKLTELLKDYEALRDEYNNGRAVVASDSNELLASDADAMKWEMERKRERDAFEKRENDLVKRLEKASNEKSQLNQQLQTLQASLNETELLHRQCLEELRLAKYNLEANKHEFDEYKQKAQKILSAKEKLLESLKQSNSGGGGGAESSNNGGSGNDVELEELRCEHELLREELQQSQLVIYNLKADIQDMENRLREEQKSSGANREALLEQCHQHLSEANQYREQMERTQLEFEFLQAEMHRQQEAVDRKLAEKDMQIVKLMEERKATKKYEPNECEQRIALMSEKLIAKQTDIERLESEKRALQLRVERSEKAYRQAEAAAIKACAIDMRESTSIIGGGNTLLTNRNANFLQTTPTDSVSIVALKSVLNAVDMIGFRLANFMRNPIFRIFFLIYTIVLHLWAFFIIFTYTPETHPL